MSPERWQQIDALFQAALDRPEHEWSAFLAEACGNDAALRAEVSSLLLHDGIAEGGLRAAVAEAAQALPEQTIAWSQSQTLAPETGSRIGPYQLEEEIGRGGMGTVYRAVRSDDAFRQSVAIKLVNRGADSAFLLSRFRHERRILASLNHPNIARILDGGSTPDGRPYFVMEYIEGDPLTKYCEASELAITPRLELFLSVCAAVQHAHEHMVVHRDLKPGNILVTRDGTPKLLDFGIAKLLNPTFNSESLALTSTGMRMMTPDYASPEQVRGETVTAATDVYALGAILFELLTGQKAHHITSLSPLEIARVICDGEITRPSSVSASRTTRQWRKQLAGDLDNIVLKALRKEPERRYPSVQQLAEDLRRWVAGLPVSASRGTLRYRSGKFLKRHWLPIAASFLLVASLTGGLIGTLYQAKRAERRFAQVRKLANRFLFDVDDQIQMLSGSTKAREMVVQTALEYLDGLSHEAGGDPDLQFELAKAYEKIGEVQGYPGKPNLGKTSAAIASYRKSVALQENILRTNPANGKVLRGLCYTYYNLGYIQEIAGQLAASRESVLSGLAIAKRFYRDTPEDPQDHRWIGEAYISLGDLDIKEGKLASAIENYNQCRIYRTRFDQAKPSPTTKRQLSSLLIRTSGAQARLGDLDQAKAAAAQAVSLRTRNLKDAPSARSGRDLMVAQGELAAILNDNWRPSLGDRAGAKRLFSEAAATAEKQAEDSQSALAHEDLSSYLLGLAEQSIEDDAKKAEELARRSLQSLASAANKGIRTLEIERLVAESHRILGMALTRQGRYADAVRETEEAVRQHSDRLKSNSANFENRRLLAAAQLAHGDALRKSGDAEKAKAQYLDALQQAKELAARTPTDVSYAFLESVCFERLTAVDKDSASWRRKNVDLWHSINAKAATSWTRAQEAKAAGSAGS